MNRKGFAPLAVVLVIAAIVIVGIGIWYFFPHKNSMPIPSTNSTVVTVSTTTAITLTPTASSSSNTSGWNTYVDVSSGLSFAFPPLGTPIQINDIIYPEESGLVNIEIGALNPSDKEMHSLVTIGIIPKLAGENLKDWFENTIDDGSSTLLTSGAFVQEQLPNGIALVNVVPIPATYQGGPVAQAYVLDPSKGNIYAISQSQDGSLTEFGYSNSSVPEILNAIAGTIK